MHLLHTAGSTASSVKGSWGTELWYTSIQTQHLPQCSPTAYLPPPRNRSRLRNFPIIVLLETLQTIKQRLFDACGFGLCLSWPVGMAISILAHFSVTLILKQYFHLIGCSTFHFSIIFLLVFWLLYVFVECSAYLITNSKSQSVASTFGQSSYFNPLSWALITWNMSMKLKGESLPAKFFQVLF